MKLRILAGSFLPGEASTPEETSTPQGWRIRMASFTFSGVRPPAIITLDLELILRTIGTLLFQSKALPVPPGSFGVVESNITALPGRSDQIASIAEIIGSR